MNNHQIILIIRRIISLASERSSAGFEFQRLALLRQQKQMFADQTTTFLRNFVSDVMGVDLTMSISEIADDIMERLDRRLARLIRNLMELSLWPTDHDSFVELSSICFRLIKNVLEYLNSDRLIVAYHFLPRLESYIREAFELAHKVV